jgi:hypothetical protein
MKLNFHLQALHLIPDMQERIKKEVQAIEVGLAAPVVVAAL